MVSRSPGHAFLGFTETESAFRRIIPCCGQGPRNTCSLWGYRYSKERKGFDTKILKKVIALRKKDEQERMEEDLILDTYLHALGMIDSPPEG